MSSSYLYFLVLLVVCFFSLPLVSGVTPPYKLCSTATAHVKINTVEVNEWPPVSGDTLEVNMTGSVDETVTSGTYAIDVTLDGIAIPPITGDIATFKALPWPQGELNMSFPQAIPGGILSGTTCKLQISAVDQNKEQLFCITMAFTFEAADTIKAPIKTHFPVIHAPHQKLGMVHNVLQRILGNNNNNDQSNTETTPASNTPRIHTRHQ